MNLPTRNINFHGKELRCIEDIGPIKKGESVYCFRDSTEEGKFYVYTAREIFGVNQITFSNNCKKYFKVI